MQKAHRPEIGHGVARRDPQPAADGPGRAEAEASLEFFKSVETALHAVAAAQRERGEAPQPTEDGEAVPASDVGPSTADVLDGFCTELSKRIQKDAKQLLGNKTVCRTIELALSAAEARHVRAIGQAFVGRVASLAASPTASFVVETLLASIYHALRHGPDADAADDDDDELVPPATLLSVLVGELAGAVSSLLWDRGGAKCIAAALLVCAGRPARGVPAHDNFASFADVDVLATALKAELSQPSLRADSEGAIHDACVHVSACFPVQALIEASAAHDKRAAAGAFDAAAVPNEVAGFLRERLPPLVKRLMADKIGTRVVECYAGAGDPSAWRVVKQLAVEALQRNDGFVPIFAVNSLIEGCRTADDFSNLWSDVFAPDASTLVSWITLRRNEAEPESAPKGKGGQRTGQPKAPHPLCKFVETIAPHAAADPSADAAVAPDAGRAKQEKQRENTEGVDVGPEFRKTVLHAICDGVKSEDNKGPARALLFTMCGGVSGQKLCEDLFRFGRIAATPLVRSVMKIPMADLAAVAETPGGSKALQRYVDCIAAESLAKAAPVDDAPEKEEPVEMVPLSGAALRHWYKKQKAEQKKVGILAKTPAPPKVPKPGKKPAPKPAEPVEASPLLKFTRRLTPALADLVRSKYGSYLVQHIFAQGAVDVRSAICEELAGKYNELQSHYLARVVLVHCRVEQYLYRRDEWRAQATRQARVRKVMAAVVAAEEAYEAGVDKAAKSAKSSKPKEDA